MATIDSLIKTRIQKLETLRKLGIDPYPATVDRKNTISQARKSFGKNVSVAGRIMAMRIQGKISFADIFDGSGKIQVVLKTGILDKNLEKLIPLIDIGDFISVQGKVDKTSSGEISVFAVNFQIITKPIRPLPDKWYGLKDIEERYRKRYLDMVLNADVRKRLEIRSKIVQAFRDFFNSKNYLEVETPTLQPVYGGGFARPFSTHHNALDSDFYLRISDEMYLKRLIVGGFEKIYEITKVFRNEGINHDHNPEFTMFEAQIAYEDYQYGMDIVEELLEYVAKNVLGSTDIIYQNQLLNFSRPWKRYRFVEAIKKYVGIDPLKWKTVDEAKKAVLSQKISAELAAEMQKMQSIGEVMAFAFEVFVEKKLIQPTIIFDFPIEVSPLAKKCQDYRFTQRFEMFANGLEIGNNYTELNDPIDLKQRFITEKRREEAGFEEAHQTDYDYLEAIEHGFPPTCGLGIGVDRVVKLFTDATTLKEIIPFPTLKPKQKIVIRKTAPKDIKYDYRQRKIVAIINKELDKGRASNALGHMAFSAGRYLDQSWMGEPFLKDADGITHQGISKFPFIILGAISAQIKNIVFKAKNMGIFYVDYPQEMFDTGTDEDLTQALSKVKEKNIVYHAVLLAGKTRDVDFLTRDLQLYN